MSARFFLPIEKVLVQSGELQKMGILEESLSKTRLCKLLCVLALYIPRVWLSALKAALLWQFRTWDQTAMKRLLESFTGSPTYLSSGTTQAITQARHVLSLGPCCPDSLTCLLGLVWFCLIIVDWGSELLVDPGNHHWSCSALLDHVLWFCPFFKEDMCCPTCKSISRNYVTLIRINPATGKKIAHYLMCSVHGCKEGFAWMNPTCQNYAHHAGWL